MLSMPAPAAHRVKSGKEVRDFLRGLGISLDSGAAVIKQARAACAEGKLLDSPGNPGVCLVCKAAA